MRQDLVDRQRRDGFVTVAEAAQRSGVCERTLRTWTRSGTLTIRRVGPMLVFVDVASLAAAAGSVDAESASALYERTKAGRTELVRELTFERDE